MSSAEETLRPDRREPVAERRRALCLTIAWHRDTSRVGEWFWFDETPVGQSVELSRLTPAFTHPAGSTPRPLDCRFVSRRPFFLKALPHDLFELAVDETIHDITIDGEKIAGTRLLRPAELERGVTFAMAHDVVLFLRFGDPSVHRDSPRAGLVGDSDAIARVRNDIVRVADLKTPVLLLGETGSGKDLVARAIHVGGPRAAFPFISINMAAIPATTASAELFGHEQGAFTGAHTSRDGCFQRANKGTIFLDEVADTPFDVQAMMLRVLETGEAQRVGGGKADSVDVRVLAATDQDLASDAQDGHPMRSALRFRLSGYNLPVPPLRDRREDVGRLLGYFLRMELAETGELERLEAPNPLRPAALSATDIGKLISYDWPGNVRQLHNFVRHLVITSRGQETLQTQHLDELLDRTEASASAPHKTTITPIALASTPANEKEALLITTLRSNRWSIAEAARRLGVSRTTVYSMLERSKILRAPKDIPEEELRQAWEDSDGDVSAAVARLEVSPRALKIRLREIGLNAH